jgi:hypothetical protein
MLRRKALVHTSLIDSRARRMPAGGPDPRPAEWFIGRYEPKYRTNRFVDEHGGSYRRPCEMTAL